MTRPRDPLEATDRLMVDGSNLAFAIRRGRTPLPATALVGRLRAAIPPHARVHIVFDGIPDAGMRNVRIASGVTVQHSGRRSADHVLLELARPGDLVVTDDRELRTALMSRGMRTAGTDWLIGRLERTTNASPTVANRRPPTPTPTPDTDDGPEEPARWQPGRRATVKRGNPWRRRR